MEILQSLVRTGGMDGPLFKDVEAANNGRLQLVRGQDGRCLKSVEFMLDNAGQSTISQSPLLATR